MKRYKSHATGLKAVRCNHSCTVRLKRWEWGGISIPEVQRMWERANIWSQSQIMEGTVPRCGVYDGSGSVCWRTVRFMRTIVIRNISAPSRRRTSTSNGTKGLSRMTSLSSNSPSVITMTYKNKLWPSLNTGYKHTYWNERSLICQIGVCWWLSRWVSIKRRNKAKLHCSSHSTVTKRLTCTLYRSIN